MPKTTFSSTIISNNTLDNGFHTLVLAVKDYPAPRPGQFINVYLPHDARLLPRPFCVAGYSNDVLTIFFAIVGNGTLWLSKTKPGDAISISSPLGNPAPISDNKPVFLISGGSGIALSAFASHAYDCTAAFAGFRTAPGTLSMLRCPSEVSTDDGSFGFRGNVVDLLLKRLNDGRYSMENAVVLLCGPEHMMKRTAAALSPFCDNTDILVSLEGYMGCGYGACVGCAVDTVLGRKRVCTDGPVFNVRSLLW